MNPTPPSKRPGMPVIYPKLMECLDELHATLESRPVDGGPEKTMTRPGGAATREDAGVDSSGSSFALPRGESPFRTPPELIPEGAEEFLSDGMRALGFVDEGGDWNEIRVLNSQEWQSRHPGKEEEEDWCTIEPRHLEYVQKWVTRANRWLRHHMGLYPHTEETDTQETEPGDALEMLESALVRDGVEVSKVCFWDSSMREIITAIQSERARNAKMVEELRKENAAWRFAALSACDGATEEEVFPAMLSGVIGTIRGEWSDDQARIAELEGKLEELENALRKTENAITADAFEKDLHIAELEAENGKLKSQFETRATECETAGAPVPGREAEELRAAIEKLLARTGDADLDHLLDEVDARDSLAYLEERQELTGRIDELESKLKWEPYQRELAEKTGAAVQERFARLDCVVAGMSNAEAINAVADRIAELESKLDETRTKLSESIEREEELERKLEEAEKREKERRSGGKNYLSEIVSALEIKGSAHIDTGQFLDGVLGLISERDTLRRERDEARAKVSRAQEELHAAHEEINAWVDASGLVMGHGDPDGLTPAMSREFWERIEKRAETAESQLAEVTRRFEGLREALGRVEEHCLESFLGGYDGEKLEIFRHGMKTACNVLNATPERFPLPTEAPSIVWREAPERCEVAGWYWADRGIQYGSIDSTDPLPQLDTSELKFFGVGSSFEWSELQASGGLVAKMYSDRHRYWRIAGPLHITAPTEPKGAES